MIGRFKDFIAVPKLNGYQSLHTTVLGLYGHNKPTEIQIRTRTMDDDAERGTAAHILYKIHGDTASKKDAYEDFIQVLMDTLLVKEDSLIPGQKIKSPTLFVFTPRGDVFEFPPGSTPVDFAYALHSDIGYHIAGTRINGRIATLDTQLNNGDVVEILTAHQSRPVQQWLDFVVTSKARSHINVALKRLSGDRVRIVEDGGRQLREVFLRSGIDLGEDYSHLQPYIDQTLDPKKIEELLYQVGQGIIRPTSFLPRKSPKKPSTFYHHPESVGVIIGGEKNIPHQMAQCCHPTFPQDIVAVLRTGGKCMIHLSDCASIARANQRRILGAFWHIGEHGKVASFSLIFRDKKGLLAEITRIFYEMQVNIIDLVLIPLEAEQYCVSVRVEIPDNDISFLERLCDRMRLKLPEFIECREFFDKRK